MGIVYHTPPHESSFLMSKHFSYVLNNPNHSLANIAIADTRIEILEINQPVTLHAAAYIWLPLTKFF